MSAITFGTSFVGRVDRVPGRCYVVTKVFQVVNVPLLPLEGCLVVEGTEEQSFVAGLRGFEGTSIPLSWKSFGWAIVRAAWFTLALLTILPVVPIMLGLEGTLGLLFGPVLGLVLLVSWFMTRRPLTATTERAQELEKVLTKWEATATRRASMSSL